MILVTGAAGKTGLAVLRALSRKGEDARALIHRADQVELVHAAGASDAMLGDLLDTDSVARSMAGVKTVYLICPNVHPREFEIARVVISAAKTAGTSRIVYHSVMYPQIESMPHHWQKLRVEEELIKSGLPFTILQPASYMQNILAHWDAVVQRGEYAVPYSLESVFSPVDLDDVAEVACQVLAGLGHDGSTYLLAGPERLSSRQMAKAMGKSLGREVKARSTSIDAWTAGVNKRGLAPYAVDALTKMFIYYDQHDFVGSSGILENLLGRPPTPFFHFLTRLK